MTIWQTDKGTNKQKDKQTDKQTIRLTEKRQTTKMDHQPKVTNRQTRVEKTRIPSRKGRWQNKKSLFPKSVLQKEKHI